MSNYTMSTTHHQRHQLVHYSLVHWKTDSLLHRLFDSSTHIIHLLIRCFPDSLVHWFTDTLTHSFSDSLNHRFIDWCNDWLENRFTESSILWFIDSSTDQFTPSLIHWCIDSLVHSVSCPCWCHFTRVSTTICSLINAPHNFTVQRVCIANAFP